MSHRQHDDGSYVDIVDDWSSRDEGPRAHAERDSKYQGLQPRSARPQGQGASMYHHRQRTSETACCGGWGSCLKWALVLIGLAILGVLIAILVFYFIIGKTCPVTIQSHIRLPGGELPKKTHPFTLRVECSEGFLTTEGEADYRTQCKADGTWSHSDLCTTPASDFCPVVALGNTHRGLPLTLSGNSVVVQCVTGTTLPPGGTSYTATCLQGLWDKDYSCVHVDCKGAHDNGFGTSGVYRIMPDNRTVMEVFCEQQLNGGGWTVLQQRHDGSVDFFKNWSSYKIGFGNVSEEFWLGNENIYALTYGRSQGLQIEMTHPNGIVAYASYASFWIENGDGKYRLHVEAYDNTSEAGEALFRRHDGNYFSTKDFDNDLSEGKNCAEEFYGGWWYGSCHSANLNGLYGVSNHSGIIWGPFSGFQTSLVKVRMMVKTMVPLLG